MSAFDELQGQITDLRSKVDSGRASYRLATVTSSGVAFDDGGTAIPAASLVATSVDDRVLTVTQARRTYVLGIVV